MLSNAQKNNQFSVIKNFKTLCPDGRILSEYTLSDGESFTVILSNFGARIVSILTTNKNGRKIDIALANDKATPLEKDPYYFGATIGRYANRIRNASFTLDNCKIKLSANAKQHHLHGGTHGFDRKFWDAKIIETANSCAVQFTTTSLDGDEGYPGNMDISVTYTLSTLSKITISYIAKTDAPTPVNLTHHSYFNLNGHDNGDILDHVMQIHAGKYAPIDDEYIPTGEIINVVGTPFDFQSQKIIGQDIHSDHQQIINGHGYDHTWILNEDKSQSLKYAGTVYSPKSLVKLSVFTDAPNLHLYTGNFLSTKKAKNGASYDAHQGFCLETQYLANSPNEPEFPSTILQPNEIYKSNTIYQIGQKEEYE